MGKRTKRRPPLPRLATLPLRQVPPVPRPPRVQMGPVHPHRPHRRKFYVRFLTGADFFLSVFFTAGFTAVFAGFAVVFTARAAFSRSAVNVCSSVETFAIRSRLARVISSRRACSSSLIFVVSFN